MASAITACAVGVTTSAAVGECSPLVKGEEGSLLPDLADIHQVSRYIAKMVAKTAMLQGKAVQTPDDVIGQAIEANFWRPEYRRYRRTSF